MPVTTRQARNGRKRTSRVCGTLFPRSAAGERRRQARRDQVEQGEEVAGLRIAADLEWKVQDDGAGLLLEHVGRSVLDERAGDDDLGVAVRETRHQLLEVPRRGLDPRLRLDVVDDADAESAGEVRPVL